MIHPYGITEEELEQIANELVSEEDIKRWSAPLPSWYHNRQEALMTTSLSKKPASVMRAAVQPVRDHAAAMTRLNDQYFADLARAQARYFEGVKRITDIMTEERSEPQADPPPAETPPAS